ncbi:MAG: nucleoside triphosphate pyrophosphohydrolase [Eggerthellaceae bacterium]|nr:nucleoside triphosphate pyrophosphohydrolase [Eggerthellaceae bacterium]
MTEHSEFNEFVATISRLRKPDGCPWDRAQTHQTIAHNMIEEAYEAVDAIDSGDAEHLREELGDVLLQVVLQSQIAKDDGEFTIDDVCRDINAKMIRRHPHVFGDKSADDANEVLALWDQVKLQEQKDEAAKSQPAGKLDSVPKSFPALMQAQKISRKAASAGFEWDGIEDVWEKVFEEIDELKSAYAKAPKSANGKILADRDRDAAKEVELEFGDVLFSLVNIARFMGIDAEDSLRATCDKFRSRWAFMEGVAWGQGKPIEDLSQEELEQLWEMSKSL